MRIWKEWGFEDIIENNEMYCMKAITCVDGKWSSKGLFHYHPIKDETFYVIAGELHLEIEIETKILKILPAGQSFRIRPGIKHRFRSNGSVCRFIEASTTHSDEDSIRVE